MRNWLFLISLGLLLSAGRCDTADAEQDNTSDAATTQSEVQAADSTAVDKEIHRPGSENQAALDSLKAEKMKQKKKDGN